MHVNASLRTSTHIRQYVLWHLLTFNNVKFTANCIENMQCYCVYIDICFYVFPFISLVSPSGENCIVINLLITTNTMTLMFYIIILTLEACLQSTGTNKRLEWKNDHAILATYPRWNIGHPFNIDWGKTVFDRFMQVVLPGV